MIWKHCLNFMVVSHEWSIVMDDGADWRMNAWIYRRLTTLDLLQPNIGKRQIIEYNFGIPIYTMNHKSLKNLPLFFCYTYNAPKMKFHTLIYIRNCTYYIYVISHTTIFFYHCGIERLRRILKSWHSK
jgi:hypothetical protein